MRKLFILLTLLCGTAWGQGIIGNGLIQYVTAAPSGSCGQNSQQQDVLGPGTVYLCQNGTWGQIGGSAGSVTSVSGTANQIDSTGGTTPVLSLDPAIILPGTINKLTLTAPATGATLTVPDGTTQTFPAATGTLANLATAQAFTNKDLTGAGNTFPTFNQNTSGSAASLSISGQTALLTFTGLASTNRIKTVRDAADTLLELGGSYTPTGTWTNMVLATPNLGTPSAATLTNANGLPVAGLSNLGSGVGTWLITPSSANLLSAMTTKTGTNNLVFSTAPTFDTTITIGANGGTAGTATFNGSTSGSTSPGCFPLSTCGSFGGNAVKATFAAYATSANCVTNTSCAAATAGMASIAAAATTVTVSTTAVTANSEIRLQFDATIGGASQLNVTCNTGTSTAATYWVSTRTNGTSFVISTSVAPVTNPACVSWSIVN